MGGFKLQRLGLIMEPEPDNLNEVEGVLNPARVRRSGAGRMSGNRSGIKLMSPASGYASHLQPSL